MKKIWSHVSVRNSRPWSRHYSFDGFCRYVLPYRLADEPLEAWRESYHRRFAARVDSIYSGSDIVRKIQAVQTVFLADGTGWSELFPQLPHPGALFLLEHPVGVCVELCDYVAYLLEREAGMGSTYGIEKGSEGGIDGHPADEGGSEATSVVSMEGKI